MWRATVLPTGTEKNAPMSVQPTPKEGKEEIEQSISKAKIRMLVLPRAPFYITTK